MISHHPCGLFSQLCFLPSSLSRLYLLFSSRVVVLISIVCIVPFHTQCLFVLQSLPPFFYLSCDILLPALPWPHTLVLFFLFLDLFSRLSGSEVISVKKGEGHPCLISRADVVWRVELSGGLDVQSSMIWQKTVKEGEGGVDDGRIGTTCLVSAASYHSTPSCPMCVFVQ